MIEVRYELSISHIMLNSFSIMLLPSLILGLNQTIHLFFKIKILENTRQKMLRKTPGTLLIVVSRSKDKYALLCMPIYCTEKLCIIIMKWLINLKNEASNNCTNYRDGF